MKLKKCRNCYSKKIEKLFSLGNLSYSGFFPQKKNLNVEKKNITLVKCKDCHLVQLNQRFNPKKLYNKGYGYRTGINKTMTDHVSGIVKKAIKISDLKKNDYVLDIASNDGTLLNFYPKNVVKVGCDPILKKFNKFYKNIKIKIPDFFSYEKVINKINSSNKFRIITAIAVFYDLNNPNKFLIDVSKLLKNNGIFILEMADLYKIIKNNMFDTICHEHLEYYSCEVVINMAKKNKLRVFDIEYNSSNGGSSRFYICHDDAKYKTKVSKINKILNNETRLGLKSKRIYKKFFNNIQDSKKKLNKLIIKLKEKNKMIFGYGASTKGNILLEYFGINNKQIDYIADRNPEKFGKFTPSSKIPIISENEAYAMNPDYYLVLPWHFKTEIIQREKSQIKLGKKFIFPLPKLTLI